MYQRSLSSNVTLIRVTKFPIGERVSTRKLTVLNNNDRFNRFMLSVNKLSFMLFDCALPLSNTMTSSKKDVFVRLLPSKIMLST